MSSASLESTERVTTVRFHRPDAANALDGEMLETVERGLDEAARRSGVLIMSGLPDVFCTGADLVAVSSEAAGAHQPDYLFDLWTRMISGDVIVVTHVRGKTAAGGVGFVAASDFVVSDQLATFALPEMLFGLMPAMVLPFLAHRIGARRAHTLAISTRTIDASTALSWGLVDEMGERSDVLLARLLNRLCRIPRDGVAPLKRFSADVICSTKAARPHAIEANLSRFADPLVRKRMAAYANDNLMPWELNDEGGRDE